MNANRNTENPFTDDEKYYSFVKLLTFSNLKGLRNVSMRFTPGLNCIIGANGTGKSTILHALASIYQKKSNKVPDGSVIKELENNMSKYFTPYSGTSWRDSEFFVEFNSGEVKKFWKNYRWNPRHENKIRRDTVYIGIKEAVPDIEKESRTSIIHLSKREKVLFEDGLCKDLNYIMATNYSNVFKCYDKGAKEFIGVSYNIKQDQTEEWCSLSLSAGTQRVVGILRGVHEARGGSLVLIEELDILLHEHALKRLVVRLHEISKNKNLQIVFTCHNPVIKDSSNVNFICLQRRGNVIMALPGFFNYDFFSLTGKNNIDVRIYCEDLLSQCIVRKILGEYKLSSRSQVKRFGVYMNAVTILAGLYLEGDLNRGLVIAVLDGDIENSSVLDCCKKALSGSDEKSQKGRDEISKHILNYVSPEGEAPEKYIRRTLLENYDSLRSQNEELMETIAQVDGNIDIHEDLKAAFRKLNYSVEVGYNEIIRIFSMTDEYEKYIFPIRKVIDDYIKNQKISF